MGVTNYATLDGEIVSVSIDGVRKDLMPDPLGSVAALVDSTGTITDTFTYWPYGEERTRTGTTEISTRFVRAWGYYWDNSMRIYELFGEYEPKQTTWNTLNGSSYHFEKSNPVTLAGEGKGHGKPRPRPSTPCTCTKRGTRASRVKVSKLEDAPRQIGSAAVEVTVRLGLVIKIGNDKSGIEIGGDISGTFPCTYYHYSQAVLKTHSQYVCECPYETCWQGVICSPGNSPPMSDKGCEWKFIKDVKCKGQQEWQKVVCPGFSFETAHRFTPYPGSPKDCR